ncbi:endolytic transglycosylase MltG [Nocardioides sp. CN2-186]|uniref:endolytic transglycosylase MltG n=1 Tax=Nocardioides tweenelious TaxID=3156607 RepID=UPI0032B46B49
MRDEQDPTGDDQMTYDDSVPFDEEPAHEPGRRRGAKRRSLPGCIAVLVALAIIAGGFYFVVTWGMGVLKDQFDSADDYSGPGHGKVSFEVHEGDTIAQMGRNLKSDGVVASVQAFTDAAAANADSTKIQVGFYPLKKEMAADDVVEILVDPDNQVKDTVTIPEGLRAVDTIAILAKKTKFSEEDFQKVIDKPDALGLPDYASGNVEGYLFPATYDFGPTATPTTMLKAMVDRWRQAADDADLESAAADLGYTPGELMTVASLVQAEGRGDAMPKIARVIYNRLENPDNGITNGLLQIDATVNYALDRSLIAVPTEEDTKVDSPYNTYANTGLPPGPIEAPGDDAIEAAAHPAEGDWLFYVTVNLATAETKFTASYDEFLQFKQELRDYCATKSDRC